MAPGPKHRWKCRARVLVRGKRSRRQTARTITRVLLPLTMRFISGPRTYGRASKSTRERQPDRENRPITVENAPARAPPRLCSRESARLGFVPKRAVTLIPVKDVSPPLRQNRYIDPWLSTIAGQTPWPAGMVRARLFRHILELQAPGVVVAENGCGGDPPSCWRPPLPKKMSGRTIIVVVEDGPLPSGVFNNVTAFSRSPQDRNINAGV